MEKKDAVVEIKMKDLRTAVTALNDSKLLAKPIKMVGVSKEEILKSFMDAVANVPDDKEGKFPGPKAALDFYNSVLDAEEEAKETAEEEEKAEEKKTEVKETKKAEKKAEKGKKEENNNDKETKKKAKEEPRNEFGVKEGTVSAKHIEMLLSGEHTMKQIKEKTGSTCYDLIKKLEKNKFKVSKSADGKLLLVK